MSKGVHVAHNKLEASLQDQRSQGGHGAIPLSAGMLLVTLGVVYGDIGTSPMYTMKSIVANNGGIGTVSEDMILGALSLVIWTMTLVTTVKYVVIAMKADNHNEGGIFALFSLVRKVAPWLILPAMIGGAALLADGILTPAVTVTTAIEGLRTIEWGHALLGDGQTNVIIITIIIICGLFAMQRAGTSSIGKLFGPLMTLWFLFLAGAGLFNMLGNLSILRALNPIRGIMFLFSPINHSGIMVLGFVFLSTTGAEALYSDMGHVGKANIYASWPFVKAALILNYLGQGAWLLANNSNPQMLAMDIVNPFYMMLPEPLRPFAIVLSAVAAIIASQALITGAFSLVSEASRLDLMPHMQVFYPAETKGQLYIPMVNNVMLVGCVIVVLLFQNSAHMEAAYGLAITLTMMCTTMLLFFYLHEERKLKVAPWIFAAFFLLLEGFFFVSSLTKFFHGGYFTILMAALIMGIMVCWYNGTAVERRQFTLLPLRSYLPQLKRLRDDDRYERMSDNVVYLTFDDGPNDKNTPRILEILKKENIKATFFLTGQNVVRYPDVVKQIYQSGNAMGLHSYTHDYKKIYQSPKAYIGEMMETEEAIYGIIGVRPIISRAPGGTKGHFTDAFWPAIEELGYVEVGWNALTGDADGTGKSAGKAVENIKQQLELRPYLHRHLVILMHDASGHGATVDALPAIIKLLKDRGYTFRVVTTAIPPSW